MDKETTRVEVLSAHYYDRDRQPGERYDCANQHLPVVLGRGLVRIVDKEQPDDCLTIARSDADVSVTNVPMHLEAATFKRKRGRPFGSHGPYKKRSVVSETSVDR